MSLSLSLKTTVKEGLILYNGGSHNDYVALEIIEGKIYFAYSLGNRDEVRGEVACTKLMQKHGAPHSILIANICFFFF